MPSERTIRARTLLFGVLGLVAIFLFKPHTFVDPSKHPEIADTSHWQGRSATLKSPLNEQNSSDTFTTTFSPSKLEQERTLKKNVPDKMSESLAIGPTVSWQDEQLILIERVTTLTDLQRERLKARFAAEAELKNKEVNGQDVSTERGALESIAAIIGEDSARLLENEKVVARESLYRNRLNEGLRNLSESDVFSPELKNEVAETISQINKLNLPFDEHRETLLNALRQLFPDNALEAFDAIAIHSSDLISEDADKTLGLATKHDQELALKSYEHNLGLSDHQMDAMKRLLDTSQQIISDYVESQKLTLQTQDQKKILAEGFSAARQHFLDSLPKILSPEQLVNYYKKSSDSPFAARGGDDVLSK